jgi:hypothetical protein
VVTSLAIAWIVIAVLSVISSLLTWLMFSEVTQVNPDAEPMTIIELFQAWRRAEGW